MREFIIGASIVSDKPVFKYTKRQFAQAMIEKGEIRITPLSSFQDTELYGLEIGDSREGTSIVEGRNILLTNHVKTPGAEEWLKEIGSLPELGEQGMFMGGRISVTYSALPLYSYCTSREYSEGLLCKYFLDPEMQYDTCVRIDNPTRFGEIISQQLFKMNIAHSGITGPCWYAIGRAIDFSSRFQIPIFFVKDISYYHQREVRTVWDPIGEIREPFVEAYKEITDLCSIQRTLSDDEKRALTGQ